MGGPGFDLNDKDFLFPVNDHTAIDSDGDMHLRVGDHMSMDMNDGSLHGTVGWDDADNSRDHADMSREDAYAYGVDPDTYYDPETDDRYEDLVGGPVHYEERSASCLVAAAIFLALAIFAIIMFIVWIFI